MSTTEHDDYKSTDARNCPLCGGELDNALHCIKCGRDISLVQKPTGRKIPVAVIIFASLLATLLAFAVVRYFRTDISVVDGFIRQESGVDDGVVYIAVENFGEYSKKLALLRGMRRERLELEREKIKILGELGEERRIERLLLNLSNSIQELTDILKPLEHSLPEKEGMPPPK